MQLDEVHGGHRQSRPVHHAADVAGQGDIIDARLVRRRFARIGLAVVPQGGKPVLAIQGVVVDRHFAIQRQQTVVLRNDEGIDLQQGQIQPHEGPVQAGQQPAKCLVRRARQPQRKSEVANLIILQAQQGIAQFTQNFVGAAMRHFLDVHASGRRSGHRHPFRRAVHQQAQIKLARNGQSLFDEHPAHRLPFGRVLISHQPPAQQFGGAAFYLLQIAGEAYTAGLAAPAGMHLGLDRPAPAAQAGSRFPCRDGAVSNLPARYRQARFAQQLFGLELM